MDRPAAYRVPFLWRREGQHYLLTNASPEIVSGVTFTIHGAGVMRATVPHVIPPGHGMEVTVAGANLPRDTILVVRWFRPSGVEYLWRIAF
jgi:hypothetical protein